VPEDDSLILSPADGRVQAVTQEKPPPELTGHDAGKQGYTRISIFLDLFDVHVNRLPAAGRIEKRVYTPGQFLNAAMDKASEKNERCGLCIRQENDCHIYVVQIAGLVARRIVCDTDEGETAVAGRRFGIIRFGSRVDVYIPDSYQLRVAPGQRAIGGETVLARTDAATQNLQTRRE
jgi:phosphatidylserine decarboxylase